MVKKQHEDKLPQRAAVGVLLVWGTLSLAGIFTDKVILTQGVTAVALVAAGYLFGFRFIKNGREKSG